MTTSAASATSFFPSFDTALSETARDLRSKMRSAVDPPRTSRHVRRTQLRQALRLDIVRFVRSSDDTQSLSRLLASIDWAEAFIDVALATASEPDIAVDSDGEILFEWLNGPREVVTVSVGPGGIINFASLAGPNRFHGVTRIGDRIPGPLLSCLAPFMIAGRG